MTFRKQLHNTINNNNNTINNNNLNNSINDNNNINNLNLYNKNLDPSIIKSNAFSIDNNINIKYNNYSNIYNYNYNNIDFTKPLDNNNNSIILDNNNFIKKLNICLTTNKSPSSSLQTKAKRLANLMGIPYIVRHKKPIDEIINKNNKNLYNNLFNNLFNNFDGCIILKEKNGIANNLILYINSLPIYYFKIIEYEELYNKNETSKNNQYVNLILSQNTLDNKINTSNIDNLNKNNISDKNILENILFNIFKMMYPNPPKSNYRILSLINKDHIINNNLNNYNNFIYNFSILHNKKNIKLKDTNNINNLSNIKNLDNLDNLDYVYTLKFKLKLFKVTEGDQNSYNGGKVLYRDNDFINSKY